MNAYYWIAAALLGIAFGFLMAKVINRGKNAAARITKVLDDRKTAMEAAAIDLKQPTFIHDRCGRQVEFRKAYESMGTRHPDTLWCKHCGAVPDFEVRANYQMDSNMMEHTGWKPLPELRFMSSDWFESIARRVETLKTTDPIKVLGPCPKNAEPRYRRFYGHFAMWNRSGWTIRETGSRLRTASLQESYRNASGDLIQ